MLRPPEFIQPAWELLSNITGWFHWEALSAIGTVGALWFIVVQSTRTSRAEQAKRIGVLTYLIGLIEPIEIVSIYENTDQEQLRKVPSDQIDQDISTVRRAMAGVAALPLDEAASIGAVEWVMTLPLALQDIERALQSRSIDPQASVLRSLRCTQEATQHFRKLRDQIQYGSLRRLVRGFLRRIRIQSL